MPGACRLLPKQSHRPNRLFTSCGQPLCRVGGRTNPRGRMRFFRGLAVPSDRATNVVAEIKGNGIHTNSWRWQTEHFKRDPSLLDKIDLSLGDTRPEGAQGTPAVCACGDRDGAFFYAWRHNRNGSDDTPVIIEFECSSNDVAIDGKDCLYTVFQMGDPVRARPFMRTAFGDKGLSYAERAWQTDDQRTRIAVCDLMIQDKEVVEAHHRNPLVIAGRYNTVFRSAFTAALPILPRFIQDVWIPDEMPSAPLPDVWLDHLLGRF